MNAYIGTIRAFGFNFAPYGWMMCSGQTLPIQQYSALFSLLGTTYGGNGTSTFNLPNLNGRVAVGTGTLPGGSTYDIGEAAGVTDVTLTQQTMPQHSHSFNGAYTATTADASETQLPTATSYVSNVWVQSTPTSGQPGDGYVAPNSGNPTVQLNPQSIGISGQSLPHPNMQPYLAINYCICVNGAYPSFS